MYQLRRPIPVLSLCTVVSPTVKTPPTKLVGSQSVCTSDFHQPTRFLDIVESPSYTDAIYAFETEYTRMCCPPNREFAIVGIAAEHDYLIESFKFDIDDCETGDDQ